MITNEKPKEKELLFSVTADDCEWQFFTAGGKGGQHQNKTASACRCKHKLSGAEGISRDHREQRRNKIEAFKRMSETPKFKAWIKIEIGKRLVTDEQKKAESARQYKIEQAVEESMKEANLKIEMMDGGEWVPYKETKDDAANILA